MICMHARLKGNAKLKTTLSKARQHQIDLNNSQNKLINTEELT